MKKFLVTYLAPASVIDDWKKTEPAKRKEAEEKMQGEWKKWMSDHAKMFVDKGAGVGKTKRVASQGPSDTQNDIMFRNGNAMSPAPICSGIIQFARPTNAPARATGRSPAPARGGTGLRVRGRRRHAALRLRGRVSGLQLFRRRVVRIADPNRAARVYTTDPSIKLAWWMCKQGRNP